MFSFLFDVIVGIIGPADNCSAACKRILEICSDESSNSNEGKEVILKILAQNTLIGRVIGKEGRNIKKIMQDTQVCLIFNYDPFFSYLKLLMLLL